MVMPDPFGSMKNFIGKLQQFRGNPMQFMMQNNLNIPQQYANDPNKAIQYLMDSGKMTQEQYNQLNQMAGNIQRNPMVGRMFGK